MTRRTVLTGPELPDLESRAFADLSDVTGDHPESLLYLTSQDHPQDPTHERWKAVGPPACLRIDTMDNLVADCFERVEYKGRVTHIDRPLLYRLAELGVEQIESPANPFSAGGDFPRAGLVDAAEGIFTELEFAGLLSPDRMYTRLENAGLSRQAPHIRELAAAIESVRETTLADEMPETFRTERMHHITEADRPLSEMLPAVDAVVVGPFLQFDALERAFLRRLVSQWPTIALLPKQIDAMEATGTDAACSQIIDTYDELGFTRQDVRAGGSGPTTRRRLVQNLYRHPDEGPSAGELTSQSLSLDYIEAETIPDEIRETARTIREAVASGTEMGDIGVVPLDSGSYGETVEEIFDAYEIPYSVEGETQFSKTALGDALETLTNLADPPRSLDTLLGLLTNPLVTVPEGASGIDHQELARLATRADTPRIASVQSEMTSDTAVAVDALLAAVQRLATADLADLTEAVTDALDTFGIQETLTGGSLPADVQRRERSSKRRLDRVLETLETTASAADPDVGTPLDRLERAVSSVTVRENGRSESGVVTICSHTEAVKHEFEQIFVLGVTAAQFPATADRLAFLEPIYDAETDFRQPDRSIEARYHLGCILGSSAAVQLSAPKRSLDGEPFTDPDILTELRRIIDVDRLTEGGSDTRPGTAEDVQRALSRASSDGHPHGPAVTRAAELDSFSKSQFGRIQRGAACAAARADPMLTEYDGSLSEETVARLHGRDDREPYSASQIETYAACGFKYYAKRILGIEPPDEIHRDPDALARGSYIHDVLEQYYRSLKPTPGVSVSLGGDFESRQERLLSTALDRLDTAFSEYPPTAFHDAWLRQVLAGLATPEVNDYYQLPSRAPDGAPPKGLFYRFLKHETAKLAATTARPSLFEARIGEPHTGGKPLQREPATIATPGGTLTVHGLIDRIDTVQNEGTDGLVVRDYKTGSTPSERDTLLGLTFQLPLYALMAESGIEETDAVGAAYYKISPPTSVNSRKGLVTSREMATWHDADEVSTPLLRYSKPQFRTHEAFRQFVTETTPQRLGLIHTSIDRGRFHPTVADPSDAGCRYCDYAAVCDVRSHQRRETIETIDESDLRTYVPPIARDVDAEDVVEVS